MSQIIEAQRPGARTNFTKAFVSLNSREGHKVFLKQIAVKNFKPFKEATLMLPPTGIVLLVGPNNSGKTALLSTLDLLMGNLPDSPTTVRHMAGAEPAEVRARFVLSTDERKEIFARADAYEPQEWLQTPMLSEIEYVFSDGSGVMLATEILVELPTKKMAVVGKVESHRGSRSSWFADLRQGLRNAPQNRVALSGSSSTSGSLVPEHLLHNEPFPLSGLLESWVDSVFHFRALRIGASRSLPLRSVPDLDVTGANLPQVLVHLRNNETSKWEQIRQLISDVVPDVGVLETPTSGDAMEIAFRDPFFSRVENIKDMGTGVEQLLLTICAGVLRAPGATAVIEELETNLHPGALRRLFRHLRSWSLDGLFVLSTHSTVFLDEAGADASTWLVERANGVATLRRLDAEVAAAASSLGVRFSDVLSSERILLVEGSTDVGSLMVWFPQLRQRGVVTVVPTGGGDRVWHMPTLKTALEAADRLGRKVLFLRDRGELNSEAQKHLDGLGCIHVLARREIENYLLDDVAAISAHIATVLQNRVVVPSAEAIREAIRSAADELKSAVVFKRVAGELIPIRFVSRDDVRTAPALELEALKRIAQKNLSEGQLIAADLPVRWARVSAEIEAAWPTEWITLAPGEEDLTRVWKTLGLSFIKSRDSVGIARAMSAPPARLATVIQAFLA